MMQAFNIIALVISPVITVTLTHLFVLRRNRKNKILKFELESYKYLVKKLDDLVTGVFCLFPHGFVFENVDSDTLLLSKAQRSLTEFYSEFIVDEFFLKDELSNKLSEIIELSKKQVVDFYFLKSQELNTDRNECAEMHKICIKRNKDIEKYQEEFKKELRTHIKNLNRP